MNVAAIEAAGARPGVRLGLLLGVLGVVYGDIGTSPLYAFKASLEVFKGDGMTTWEVMGILSLMFWSLVLVVTIKYVILIMRADNRGEGGILALMALALRVSQGSRMHRVVALVGISGACLFFGDGTITPAISVLSAVEGLEVVSPELKEFVLPGSAVVILLLFLVQSHGTETMGRVFGPIMAVWFGTLGVLGVIELVGHPYVLQSVNPFYAFELVVHYRWTAFVALGAIVLTVTGAEALYADMGHFGRRPIRLAWLFYVLPCLVLNYFGQGALVLSDPTAVDNPFFKLGPDWLRLPMVILATAATVIASQAMISGAYSIARQCTQLGFLPRMAVSHTSATEEGQIYLPQVNFALLLGVLILVVTFRTSDSLAAAYGIAVTGTFTCTCVLAMVVFRRQYGWSRPLAVGVFGLFFLIDFAFFASNVLKVPEGGWVPLVLGGALVAIMTSWKRGRDLLLSRWKQDSLPLASFLARLPQSRTIRVPGIAIFLTGNPDYVPNALLHNLKHNKVLHERVLFVTVHNEDIPEIRQAERTGVEQLAPGIHRVVIRYGFMESPNIPRDLAELRAKGVEFDPMQASYFLGRETIVSATTPKMSLWRLWLFLLMARNAVSATEFFRIPSDRVVELGVRVAI
ncbi:putative potassium transport system protein kup [Rhodovastum atsumiense]|uniref:Probable potassium transport system protein Kup n=1 Tax=Rhodovastum atsumiense TaxID=504468 RepID=A0A5M6IS15_9PROT|nr:potassium transporter Kup [Rhodovastum atsumiense]KAA5610368.1 potassium transporter Kup [Rhodovastum atsumiense]CAH2600885.1 putative potassium transport system protein kup [Rhodovastum atsumiense]